MKVSKAKNGQDLCLTVFMSKISGQQLFTEQVDYDQKIEISKEETRKVKSEDSF